MYFYFISRVLRKDKSENPELISQKILNDVVSNFETKQDKNAICQNILDNVITNFETSEDKKIICEGILLDVIEDMQAKAQLQVSDFTNFFKNFVKLITWKKYYLEIARDKQFSFLDRIFSVKSISRRSVRSSNV